MFSDLTARTILMRGMLFLLPVSAICAQTKISFDVASIRLSLPLRNGSPVGLHGGPGTADPTRVTIYNTTLVQLILDAYDLSEYRVKMPANFSGGLYSGERFDLRATMADGTSKDQYRLMLRNLLEERFALRSHSETKQSSVFELTVNPRGHRLAEHGKPRVKGIQDPGDRPIKEGPFANLALPMGQTAHLRVRTGAMLQAWDMSMAEFGKQIEPTLHAPVIDATGLTKRYDFRLDYDSEMTDEPGVLPRLPTAVQQQLGLRLRPSKGPVVFLVVDSIQKMPTEN